MSSKDNQTKMTDQVFQTILTLVSGLISIFLMVVGYQLKQQNSKTEMLVKGISEITQALALIGQANTYTDQRIKKNEKDIEKLDNEVIQIRGKLHDVVSDLNSITLKLSMSCDKLRDTNFFPVD